MSPLPTHAQIIVLGGGIIGCSTAYHLAKFGAKDVILLERKKLTSGTTFHAAGLVGQLRSSANVTRLLKESVALYQGLEAETGQATGWKMNGGLRLACNAERLTEIKRQATTAHSFGLEMHLLSPKEALDLFPIMDNSDVVGAAFLPTDGQANPSDITLSLAKGARMRGVKIFEDVEVTGICVKNGRVTGVKTAQGEITCETIVCCAGQWSREIGLMAGVTIPVQSVEHQYLITEACGVPRNLPTLRDPDRLIYYKEDVGGLVMGGYEPNPIAWADDGIPKDFHFSLLSSRWDHFEPTMEQALFRTPILQTAGVRQLLNGPEAFTPDGNFILGEAPEVAGFFVGCGFNAFGIASAGGAGWGLAQWILDGRPPMDLWPVDIRRFSRDVHGAKEFVKTRTLEAYSKHYTMAWPHEEMSSARMVKVSPLYERLKQAGACFGSKLGWERPNWFAANGLEPRDTYTYGRQNWFDAVGEEHRAVRERAGLFDQTSFAKFELRGRDARKALDWLCANHVTGSVGSLTYTQMLNQRGGIEADLTVAHLAEDKFYIVTGTGFRTHDFSWIARNIPSGLDVQFEDMTGHFGVLSLMGPRARDILAKVSRSDVSNAALPFMACKIIDLGGPDVRALRVTYVGELGYELHIAINDLPAAYDRLIQAGAEFGLKNCGYRAIDSLRLEKGYRAWGADINADSTPFEAGLRFAVRKSGGFQGEAALKAAPLKRMLATFTVDDPSVVLLGRETIFRNGEQVGYLTSGGFGYTLNTNIGMGYVRQDSANMEAGITRDFVLSGDYELEIACARHAAKVSLAALYDPANERVRG